MNPEFNTLHRSASRGEVPTVRENNTGETYAVSASCWAETAGVFSGTQSSYEALPPGLYKCSMEPYMGGPVLIKQTVDTDKLLDLPDSAVEEVIAEFDLFWGRRQEFVSRGFLQKRGFLLHGPPGSGKTSCVNLIVKRLIEDHNGVILYIEDPLCAAQCLRLLRRIEPGRPIVCVLEDIDALVARHGEAAFLSLLDGEAQVDRIVFVATTNYPENLDSRMTDRPSRFDTVKFIGMPNAAARDLYLSVKEPGLTKGERAAWVSDTEGFSLAHIKELVIAVKCLGQTFSDALSRIEGMRQKPNSEDSKRSERAGFLSPRKGNGYAVNVGYPR